FVAMRLMGKRQLGELQPFEFAITLVAAELACIPMADATIPIFYGIVPVFTLFLLHFFITKMAVFSIRFRRVLNGRPSVVIEKGNIQCDIMKQLSMNTNDLLEALRGAGYFTPADVEYAIVETSGKLSVLPKFANSPATNADLNIMGGTAEMPSTIIVEGKFLGENLRNLNIGLAKDDILSYLGTKNYTEKDIYLLTLTEDKSIFCQPYAAPSFNETLG
ncbi:MAG: DUF421 domain-containing protein, partial [Christensenellales bacterium]